MAVYVLRYKNKHFSKEVEEQYLDMIEAYHAFDRCVKQASTIAAELKRDGVLISGFAKKK